MFLAFFLFLSIKEFRHVVEKSSFMTEQNLPVDLTFHNFLASLLKEFALRIVKPYFNGSVDEAIRSLMEQALTEESLVQKAVNK